MNDQVTSSKIHDLALKRAISILEGLRLPYAIIDALNKKHGSLEIKGPDAIVKINKYPRGERSTYCRTFLEKMSVGDVIAIQAGKYDVVSVQATSISAANRMWSAGSITTTIDREKHVVEILRIK